MPSSCCQPKPLEAGCMGKCPIAELPGQTQLSDRGQAQGLVLAVGCSLRAGSRSRTQPSQQGSSAPRCLQQLRAGMSHLVGSHLQSLLLKQFHSLGGWKTGHQLCVSGGGSSPSPTHKTRAAGGLAGEGRGEAKSLQGQAWPASFCKLSLGSPGRLSTGQREGWGLPAHLDGCVSIPEHLPAADAAVDAAHGHEQAEGEEVAVVVVSHTVV